MERKVLLSAQKGYLRLFVFLLFIITGSTQEIILQPSNSSSTRCSDGSVVDGKAQVVMVGLVVADGTKPREFTFYKRRVGDASPTPVCKINADTEECDGKLATPCYCQKKTGNTYRVVYNMTADKQDSNAILTLGYDVDRSSDQQLPTVHGVESVSVTIDGGDSKILLSSLCSQQKFHSKKKYDFQICGQNLVDAKFYIGAKPVVGSWKKAVDGCSSFSVTNQSNNLIFAYSETRACHRNDNVTCPLDPDEACHTSSLSCWLLVFCLWLVQLVGSYTGRSTEEISQTSSGKSVKMGKKAPNGYLRLFVFLTFITGSTQEIILQPSNSSNARCSDGSVVDGKAHIVMVGLVVADGTKPREFTFYKRRVGDADTTPVCKINADIEGCVTQSTTPCYCQKKTGNTYRVVYNMTADKQDSNAILTLGYDGDRSSEQHLPIVHSVERVRVTIAGVGYNIPLSSICSHTFSPGRAYAFTICAENLEGVEFYIGTNAIAGPWKTAINNCWSFPVTLETTPLIFAYRETQACLRSGSEKCTQSETAGGGDDTDLGMMLGIVFGLLALIVIIVLILYFCWWSKREKFDKYGDKEMDEPQTDPNFKAPPQVFYSKPSKHKDEKDSGEFQMKVDKYEREQDVDA